MHTPTVLGKDIDRPKINLPKHKDTNSAYPSYNLGKYIIELHHESFPVIYKKSGTVHQPQRTRWMMHIIQEETKQVMLEQPIRHDTIFERDPVLKDQIRIVVDKKELLKIKLEDSQKLNYFLADVEKLKNPEAQKFKQKYGDINTYTDEINSNEDTYYFVSVLRNKRDLSYARGSVVKAMSIASKYRWVVLYSHLTYLDLLNHLVKFLTKL